MVGPATEKSTQLVVRKNPSETPRSAPWIWKHLPGEERGTGDDDDDDDEFFLTGLWQDKTMKKRNVLQNHWGE